MINYLYFYFFLWYWLSQKRGVEFRHSTRNALKKSAERGKRSVLTLASLWLTCYMRENVKSNNNVYYICFLFITGHKGTATVNVMIVTWPQVGPITQSIYYI